MDCDIGAIMVVVEGVQPLGQFEWNWIRFRTTAEAPNSEKALYLAQPGQ